LEVEHDLPKNIANDFQEQSRDVNYVQYRPKSPTLCVEEVSVLVDHPLCPLCHR
jgi:hypothetical protein